MYTLYPTRVVLSTGRSEREAREAVTPARIVVSADLGLGFSAMPRETQRRAIERALADALELALAKLDEGTANSSSTREVAA